MVPIWMLHAPALSILPGLYATVSDIDLAVIGAILVFSRIFDGLTDPLVGMLSDMTNTPFGRRKPWIIAGGLLCMVGAWFWFRPGADTGAAYFLVASIAVYLGWTMVEIPHAAWLSEISSEYGQRSRISGIRTAAIYLGYVLFWLGPFMPFFASTAITPDVTAFLSWLVIALLVLTIAFTVSAVPAGTAGAPQNVDLRAALHGMRGNRPMLMLAVILLSAWLASGMVAGLYFFFVGTYLGIPEKFGHVGLAVATIGFASSSVWGWLGSVIGKHRVLAICNLSTVLTLVAMAFLRPGPRTFHALLLIFSLSSFFSAGSTVAYYALMGDVVDYDELKTGTSKAGSYFALITLFQKIGLGAGAGFALFITSLGGFNPNASNAGLAMAGFFIAFLGIPIVLNVLATVLAAIFPITEHRHTIIRRRLELRAARAAGA
jgi:Na+/melibiose symporter-like transporter